MPITSVGQLEEIIYDGFYRSIRIIPRPRIRRFFDEMTVAQAMGNVRGPTERPDLWWESIVNQIQSGLLLEDFWALDVDVKWLKNRKDKVWSEVRDEIQDALIPATHSG